MDDRDSGIFGFLGSFQSPVESSARIAMVANDGGNLS